MMKLKVKIGISLSMVEKWNTLFILSYPVMQTQESVWEEKRESHFLRERFVTPVDQTLLVVYNTGSYSGGGNIPKM